MVPEADRPPRWVELELEALEGLAHARDIIDSISTGHRGADPRLVKLAYLIIDQVGLHLLRRDDAQEEA